MRNPEKMEALAFLTDISSHPNNLNLKPQGKNHTVCELMSALRAFQRKLEVFKSDLQMGCLDFYNTHYMDFTYFWYWILFKTERILFLILPTVGTAPPPQTFGPEQRNRRSSATRWIWGEADWKFQDTLWWLHIGKTSPSVHWQSISCSVATNNNCSGLTNEHFAPVSPSGHHTICAKVQSLVNKHTMPSHSLSSIWHDVK